MSLETGLRAELVGSSGVKALVGNRVYPEVMPHDVKYPAISYQRISTVRTQFLTGIDDFTHVQIQIDCWDNSYSGVKALADAVKSALDGVRVLGTESVHHCFMVSMTDLSQIDGDREDRRISMDFTVYINE